MHLCLFFKLERKCMIHDDDHDNNNSIHTHDDIMNLLEEQRGIKSIRCRHRKSHGKISFNNLAKTIVSKWRILDTKTKD